MKRYTVDDIMAFRPCDNYTRDRVEELWDGREALTAEEIAELDIPIMDRLWAMSRLGVDPTNRGVIRIALDAVRSDALMSRIQKINLDNM